MLGQQFYHETMRKVVVAFGTIFNNINIVRTNSSGAVTQSMKVPLAYGPKQKFLTRLREDPNLNKKVSLTLPRIGFEISGISYDSSRKLNSIQKLKKVNSSTDGKTMSSQFMPVPYNMDFELFIMAKSSDDALQIVEQILPFFQPEYTVTMNIIPELDIKRDIPIIINSVNYEDTYNGEFTQRRAVIYTLNFTAKTYLYGPMTNQGVIKTVQADLGADTEAPLARDERIVVTPNPTTADSDDDFGFTTTITSFTDSKRYNPKTDTDE